MIIKLVLENFITLLKNGITKFELTEVNLVNILISVNGSGKTSILKELNPLPAENGNYNKGRKYVEVKHNGKLYKLESRTGIGNGHSFIIVESDGTENEMNPNGTFTVQKDLVYKYLGLDQRLVKALGGLKVIDRFSAMSANARKDLLMQIYPNDTQYSLSVYNKLRSERNELKAVIKNLTLRYAEENKKLESLDSQSIDDLERNIKYLEKELKDCLLIRGEISNAKINPSKHEKISRFNYLTDKLAVNRLNRTFHSKRELLEKLIGLNIALDNFRRSGDLLKHEIADKQGSIEGLDELISNPESFNKQLAIIEEDKAECIRRLEMLEVGLVEHELFKDLSVHKNLYPVLEELIAYIDRVVLVSDESLTGSKYLEIVKNKNNLSSELTDKQELLGNLKHKLNHYLRADDVECPDCNSKFKVGVTKQDIENLKQMVSGLEGQIELIEKALKKLTEKVELDEDWFRSMNQLFNFVKSNSQASTLGEVVSSFAVGKIPNVHIINTLYLVKEKFELTKQLSDLSEEEKVVRGRISLYDKNNILDLALHINHLEKELSLNNDLIANTRNEISFVEGEIKMIESYYDMLDEVKLLKEDILKILNEEGEYKLRQVLDQKISDITNEKNKCLSDIISNRTLSSVVNSISEELNKSKKRLEVVEVLINGLCPNKGLIGKQMSDFNETICGNVNTVLKEIWDSKLFVKPCSKENGDLTYKFPVVTEDGEPTPDISDCSGGETDIIDWAFRFVLLNYVDFKFPLIMDEVGTYLDEIKRGRFSNFIKEYTERKDARQLFLVSHYFVQYAVFKDANFIGLKYDGLTLPGKINQNVKIV